MRSSTLALLVPVLLAARGEAQEAPARSPQTWREQLEASLRSHRFFSRVSWEMHERAPYLFVVQRPPKEDPGYAAKVTTQYAEILDPIVERFEELVALPCALEPKREFPFLTVAILAGEGDFDTYMQVSDSFWHHEASSAYDHELRIAIAHESPFAPRRDPAERARSARHALVHVLEQAYCPRKYAPVRTWLFEGLADFLTRLPPKPSDPSRPDPEALKEFAADAGDAQLRLALVRTLPEMFTVNEPDRLFSFLRMQAQLELGEQDHQRAWWAFYTQGALLVHFLHQAHGGKHRPGLIALLAASFRGTPASAEALALSGGTDVRGLEQAFLSWVVAEHRAAWPKVALDEADLRLVPVSSPAAAAAAPSAAAAAPDRLADARVSLSLADATSEERFALALLDVRRGKAAAGAAAIDALLAAPGESALALRFEREKARVAQWIRLRDRFLERLSAEQGSLQYQSGERRLRAKLVRIEAGELVLEGRTGSQRLAIEALDALELAQQMESAKDGWMRFYPYVLGGDERWKRLLKDESPEALALRADADDLAHRMQVAEAADRLGLLASAAPPASAAEARASLEQIAAIGATSSGLELVQRKRAGLMQLADDILQRLFELEGPLARLRARVQALEGGRIALVYEFDDPAELEDFEVADYTQELDMKPLPGEHANALRMEGGMLKGDGRACLRTRFDLTSPQVVRYSLEFQDTPLHGNVFVLNVGICDDGKLRFAWGCGTHQLQVWDPEQQANARDEKPLVYLDRTYEMELRHDGSRVTLSRDGEAPLELPYTARRSGAVFLYLHSELPVRIRRLSIEGSFGERAFDRMRASWVAAELARLFPDPASDGKR